VLVAAMLLVFMAILLCYIASLLDLTTLLIRIIGGFIGKMSGVGKSLPPSRESFSYTICHTAAAAH
jgi:hypothetical protein